MVKLKVEDIVQHLVARTNQWCGPKLWIHIPSSLIYSLTFAICICNAVQCWTVFLYFNGIRLKLNSLIKYGTRESMLVNKSCERVCLIRNIWILSRCQFVMRENKNLNYDKMKWKRINGHFDIVVFLLMDNKSIERLSEYVNMSHVCCCACITLYTQSTYCVLQQKGKNCILYWNNFLRLNHVEDAALFL